jgi:hypothetical protein
MHRLNVVLQELATLVDLHYDDDQLVEMWNNNDSSLTTIRETMEFIEGARTFLQGDDRALLMIPQVVTHVKTRAFVAVIAKQDAEDRKQGK